MLVELCGTRIDRVHNNSRSGYFGRLHQHAVQGIHKKELADALPLETPINGKTAEQCSRNQRIARKFLRHISRQLSDIDAVARQCVIAKDRGVAALRSQNEWCGTAATEILSRLFLQVPVERCIATRETRAVVVVAKGFNHPFRWMSPVWHLDASDIPVTPGGLPQPLARWIRFQQRIHEDPAITAAEREHLMLPDSAGRDFLGTTHNEFRK
jgi:hypothetical protein